MKWTKQAPTEPGLYWFESAPLNIGARIVHVIEDCGSLLVDDHEFDLYDHVESFHGACWSNESVPVPTDETGKPVIRLGFGPHWNRGACGDRER